MWIATSADHDFAGTPKVKTFPGNINHHHPGAAKVRCDNQDNIRREANNIYHEQQPLSRGSSSSSRWTPTPEQLLTLEEMYRRGTRTPTAQEIQQIATQLRRFGKIEGKNVFYWFQNHKARERQKRRRGKSEMVTDHYNKPQVVHHKMIVHECSLDNIKSGFRRTPNGDEKGKNCEASSLNSKNKYTEGHVPNSVHKVGDDDDETASEKQGRRDSPIQKSECLRKHAMWLTNKDFSSQSHGTSLKCSTTSSSQNHHHQPNFYFEQEYYGFHKQVETLELFPLGSSSTSAISSNGGIKKDIKVAIRGKNTMSSPNQFFEFLPLTK